MEFKKLLSTGLLSVLAGCSTAAPRPFFSTEVRNSNPYNQYVPPKELPEGVEIGMIPLFAHNTDSVAPVPIEGRAEFLANFLIDKEESYFLSENWIGDSGRDDEESERLGFDSNSTNFHLGPAQGYVNIWEGICLRPKKGKNITNIDKFYLMTPSVKDLEDALSTSLFHLGASLEFGFVYDVGQTGITFYDIELTENADDVIYNYSKLRNQYAFEAEDSGNLGEVVERFSKNLKEAFDGQITFEAKLFD